VPALKRWAHQAREFQIGREKRARYLIWPMRSGKSKACIDKAAYQFGRGTIQGVVVIAPNGVHLNWANTEIPKHCSVNHRAFAWSTPRRHEPEQMGALNRVTSYEALKFFCINMEALKHLDARRALNQFIAACDRKFMLVISEAHHFGRPGSRRTYFARSLSLHAAFVQEESGTPILNSPLRAYSQFEILRPGSMDFSTYTEFREHYADFEPNSRTGGKRYKKVTNYKNLDELRAKIAPWCSVVLRSDLHDMPELIRTERPVVMSELQRNAYLEMVNRHIVEIGDNEISALDGGARVQKLQQIVNGYLMKDGVISTVDAEAPIYDVLMEQIEGTLPGKSLIWCRYREDILRVTKLLHSKHCLFTEYHGGITDPREREANRIQFNLNDTITACVGTPAAGGEGLDFSGADAVIFFSAVPNARMMVQAEERATVKGGKPVAVVRLRTPGTIDDRIWEIVDGNIKIADLVSGRGLRDLLERTAI
jgi:hypothetical protein